MGARHGACHANGGSGGSKLPSRRIVAEVSRSAGHEIAKALRVTDASSLQVRRGVTKTSRLEMSNWPYAVLEEPAELRLDWCRQQLERPAHHFSRRLERCTKTKGAGAASRKSVEDRRWDD